MCQNKIGRKITKKNPNVQIKFILFCHLQDFFYCNLGGSPLGGPKLQKKMTYASAHVIFLKKNVFFLYNRVPRTLYSTPFLRITICPSRKTF